MNETTQNILNRRSVRVFSDKQIDKNELTEILNAGIYAPSAHNQQPWHFTVIQDEKLIDELNLETKVAMSKHEDPTVQQYGNNEKYHIFYNSPTIIVVSGENSALVPKTGIKQSAILIQITCKVDISNNIEFICRSACANTNITSIVINIISTGCPLRITNQIPQCTIKSVKTG
ncbi:MAG: nitroreductase family protein [bacterium]